MAKREMFIIASESFRQKPHVALLNEFYDYNSSIIGGNFSKIKSDLIKKVDLILLEPRGIGRGNEKEFENLGYNVNPHYFGKKVLTDLIRKDGSLNEKTPTIILLDGGDENLKEEYTEEKYLQAGANEVIYKTKPEGYKIDLFCELADKLIKKN